MSDELTRRVDAVREHYAQVCKCAWSDDEFTRTMTSEACSIHGRVTDPLAALAAALSEAETRAARIEAAARAWLEHFDRGHHPAGSLPALERWYQEADTLPERMREALAVVGEQPQP